MSLHDTVENMKKVGIGTIFGVAGIIVLVILFKVAVFMKNVIFPPKIVPPSHVYGELAAIKFPKSTASGNFTYSIDTTTGNLTDFPMSAM